MFQSTLPHGERPMTSLTCCLRSMVSIHAPAWGATLKDLLTLYNTFVSIHAPAWGATSASSYVGMVYVQFQSTLPHGERPLLCCQVFRNFLVSIHAPAWGATHIGLIVSSLRQWFQSTLPHGERRYSLPRVMARAKFQSTLPHGERPRFGIV